jgi:rod shape-determining protein MreD
MRIPREILLLFVIFFIQQLPMIADWGIDLPLIFVILIGLRSEPTPAAAWGFVVGLIQDLLSSGGIGPNTVTKAMTGLGACFFKMRIYREKVSTQTFLIFGMSIFHGVFEYLLVRWEGSAPRAEDAFWLICRGVSLTTLVGFVVCLFVVRFRRRRFDPATA